ncbi:hypothetical protein HYFRA_00013396 [Hymenoscyphus fraxineus]|uniref:Cytochrome P450 n=1 Tax=Hymenoscyphus fraxineus TaxID=746836 RepID=A0A9N9L9N0_9HELO|nr:hypothetical protein HYFRA_00013396 [Hymenoscyphus fraxineus]
MDPLYEAVKGNSALYKIAAFVILSLGALLLAYRRAFTVCYARELPRLGKREGVSWKAMKKRFQTDSLSLLNEVYENYSKKGQSVLIPKYGPHDEVILPPGSLPWIVKQPDHLLSSHASQNDAIQLEHSLGPKFAFDAWGGMLVKSDLTAVLETMGTIMLEQVGPAVDAAFGMDVTEWNEIDLFPACRLVTGKAVMGFTLGDSVEGRKLCRDEGFIQSCYNTLDGMLEVAGEIGGARKVYRTYLGHFSKGVKSMPAKLKDLADRFAPVHTERLQIIQSAAEKKAIPKDLLQMLMEYAIKERTDEATSLEDMTKRLAVSNFGTIHQTVLTLHNILLNVIATDKEFDTMSLLREEFSRVLGDDENNWTRAKVAAMLRADSIARETLRAHTFLGLAMERIVVAPNGIVTEDGILLQKGTKIGILAHQMQHDPDLVKDPQKYDPFRFSRQREANPDLHNLSFVATSAENLPFNHGKHACPGRGLIDIQFKMLLSYIVKNYDLEFPESYEGKRPANTWFAEFGVPPITAKIRVRRKEASS